MGSSLDPVRTVRSTTASRARDREEGIVDDRTRGTDGDVVPCRMHAIREHDDHGLRIGIDPHAGPGEAEMAERARPGTVAGARARRALAVEAGA